MKEILFFILSFFAYSQVQAQEGWTLVFEDNFDGNELDKNKWYTVTPWFRSPTYSGSNNNSTFALNKLQYKKKETPKIIGKKKQVH